MRTKLGRGCYKCESGDMMYLSKYYTTKRAVYRWQCRDCGAINDMLELR